MQEFNPSAQSVAKIIETDLGMLKILTAVRALDLPDCWIGAGFVRNKVWDFLTGRGLTSFDDIDVIYFNPECLDEARDLEIQRLLQSRDPQEKWSVKNQARMHLRNGDAPYRSSEHAISHWPETATAIAASLGTDGKIRIIAPLGYEDLFSFIIRPTPAFSGKMEVFQKRKLEKDWKKKWPNLRDGLPTSGS